MPIIHLGEGQARKGPPATPALCRALGNEALILHPLYVSEARCQGGDLIKQQRGARFPTSLWDTYVQALATARSLRQNSPLYTFVMYTVAGVSAQSKHRFFPPHHSRKPRNISVNEEGTHPPLISAPLSGAPPPPGGHTWNRPGFLTKALGKKDSRASTSQQYSKGWYFHPSLHPSSRCLPEPEVLRKAEVDSVSLWNLGSVTALLWARLPHQ